MKKHATMDRLLRWQAWVTMLSVQNISLPTPLAKAAVGELSPYKIRIIDCISPGLFRVSVNRGISWRDREWQR